MAKSYITLFLIEHSRSEKMRVKYFPDTDTALIEFSENKIIETKEINENIYLDLDIDGNLVNITIEHAKEKAGLTEFAYQEMVNQIA
jgi:uncharacterized protein YuzE